VNDSPIEQPGSPEWWSSRATDPDPTIRGPGRPPLAPGRIIDAAIEILDDEGADALSMRTLATRLGSSTATLYRHFNSKDEIVAYITDRILSQTNLEGVAFDTWQQACRGGARALYATLTQHPNAIPLFVKQVPIGPGALAARERGIGVLLAARFPPQLAARGYTALAHFVVGFALQQQFDETADPERASQLRDYYRALDSRTYPATITVADVLPGATIDEEFEFGLNLIIDGLENALACTTRTESKRQHRQTDKSRAAGSTTRAEPHTTPAAVESGTVATAVRFAWS
jgi:AcrR family transcriptional regulator